MSSQTKMTAETKPRMDEPEYEPMQQQPLFPRETQVDGRGDELADHREEGRRRAQVLNSVADYLGNRKRRHR